MDPNSSSLQLKIFKMALTLRVISKLLSINLNSSVLFSIIIIFVILSINTSSKEYGFGQSILYENQLVFHTPPYSLQPVSLQECYEYIGKTNIRVTKYDPEPKSPHNVENLCSSSISPIEKSDRQSNAARNTEGGSPNVFDRKLRKNSIS